MAVSDFRLTGRTLYANGRQFGDAGAYERVDGVLMLAVDPEHPANDLVQQGYALQGDVELIVGDAAARWDYVAGL